MELMNGETLRFPLQDPYLWCVAVKVSVAGPAIC